MAAGWWHYKYHLSSLKTSWLTEPLTNWPLHPPPTLTRSSIDVRLLIVNILKENMLLICSILLIFNGRLRVCAWVENSLSVFIKFWGYPLPVYRHQVLMPRCRPSVRSYRLCFVLVRAWFIISVPMWFCVCFLTHVAWMIVLEVCVGFSRTVGVPVPVILDGETQHF